MTFPWALLSFVATFLFHKLMDVLVTLLSERDFFKSGHLQFVHNFKEGLIILDDWLKTIKLINVAACQLLQLPFSDDCSDTSCFERIGLKKIELGKQVCEVDDNGNRE